MKSLAIFVNNISDDLLKFKTKKPISRTIKEVVWKHDYLKN